MKKKKSEKVLCEELQQYKAAGIKLSLNGNPSSPKKIAKACNIGEEKVYMRDYVSDDSDEIVEIGFIRIKDTSE